MKAWKQIIKKEFKKLCIVTFYKGNDTILTVEESLKVTPEINGEQLYFNTYFKEDVKGITGVEVKNKQGKLLLFRHFLTGTLDMVAGQRYHLYSNLTIDEIM